MQPFVTTDIVAYHEPVAATVAETIAHLSVHVYIHVCSLLVRFRISVFYLFCLHNMP